MKENIPHQVSWKKTGLLLVTADVIALSILYEVIHYLRLRTWADLVSYPFFGVLAAVLITLYVMDVYRVETPATVSRLPVTAAFASLL